MICPFKFILQNLILLDLQKTDEHFWQYSRNLYINASYVAAILLPDINLAEIGTQVGFIQLF